MAQVPETPGMQVMPTIMGYRPMSDAVPTVPGMGVEAGLQKAGGKLDRMFTKFLDEQDEARVTEAVAELQRRATQMQTEEGGWASKLGTNATTPDEQGRGLVEQVDTSLREYGTDIASRLTPRQQRKFSQRALGVYQQTFGNVSQHVLQQGLQNRITAQTSYISALEESGAANYNRPEQLTQALERINSAQDTIGEFKGLPSEIVAQLKRQSADRLYGNAMDQYLSFAEQDPTMARMADGILRANSKYMTGSTVAKYRRQIDGYTKLVDIRRDIDAASAYADTQMFGGDITKIVKDGTLTPQQAATEAGAVVTVVAALGGYSQLEHDLTDTANNGANFRYGVSKMRIGDAYDVAKKNGLFSGELEEFSSRFMNDKGFNVQIATMAAESAIRDYAGDMTKVFASMRIGREAVDKAVAEADKTGQPWINGLSDADRQWVNSAIDKQKMQGGLREVMDEKGNPIRTTDPRYYSRALQTADERDVRRYVRENCPRAQWDVSYENTVVNGAMARQKETADAWVAQHTRLVASATEAILAANGNLSAVPQPILSRLTLKEQEDLEATAKKLRSPDADLTDPMAMAVYSDPKVLRGLTEDGLIMIRPRFSQKDFNALVAEWSKIKLAEGEAKDQAIIEQNLAQKGIITDKAARSISLGDVRSALETQYSGFSDLDKDVQSLIVAGARDYLSTLPLDNDKEVFVNGAVNIANAVRRYVRPKMIMQSRALLPDKERDALLLDPVKVLDNSGMASSRKVLEALSHMKYPDSANRAPTDLELRNTWVDLILFKTPRWFFMQNGKIPLVQFDENRVKQLQAKAGGNLNGAELVREYIFDRIAGNTPKVSPLDDMPIDRELMEASGFSLTASGKADKLANANPNFGE